MNFKEHGILFAVVIGILSLLVASPALTRMLVSPQTEFFTEFWILDSNHRAEDYPSNITRTTNYSVFLGIGNHLGNCSYYLIEVKFRNQTQSAADSFSRTPSSLPSLFNITAFVANAEVRELPLTFSFDYEYNETVTQVYPYSLTLNNAALDIRNCTVAWDSEKEGFFGYLFFELEIFNEVIGGFQYHERFVSLQLNMTV